MKDRGDLPVPEEWGPDRVVFRFQPHPSRLQLVVLGLVLFWAVAPVAAGFGTYGALMAVFAEMAPSDTLLWGAAVVALVVALSTCFVPPVVWQWFDVPTEVVVSRDKIAIGGVVYRRSDVADVAVKGVRLRVDREGGSTVHSPPLLGLNQPAFREALDRFRPTEEERLAERKAAGEVRRELAPLRERR